MKSKQLFRQAALENNQVKWLGDIVLVRPLTFSLMAAIAGFFAILVLSFLFFASYTKRSTVSGQLVPDMGVLKVHAQQVGIVSKKQVIEGQQVVRGQVLFMLSSERQNANARDTQASISRQVAARQASLREELRKTESILNDEKQALATKISAMETESDKITSQLDGQKSRVKLAQDALARAQELLAQNFISREQLQQKQADLLDQGNRLQAIERDQLSIQRELANERNKLQSLPLRHQNQLAQLERMIASTGQELTESEAKRSLLVSAPENGTVTAISAEVGQLIDPGKPMLSIVPQGAQLLAELYIPSRAIGFVRKDSAVLLRYQAYPYQKFGHGRGKVLHVSKTALSGTELSLFATAGRNSSEPMYRVIVQLDTQTVHAYGKTESLQAGMLLEADVLQDTRRLYEWVLEPLYSLTGKL